MNERRYRINGKMNTEMRQNTSMIGREVTADMRGLFEIEGHTLCEGHKRNGAGNMRPRRSFSHAGIMLRALFAIIFAFALTVPTLVQAATSGPNSPTAAAGNAAVGTVAWTNPGNAYTSNNLYATAAMGKNIISNYLVASGFNFAIPAGSTIDGIAVSVERKEGTTFTLMTIQDNSVKLVKGGAITGTEHAVTTAWGSTETTVNYGSGTDLWGTAWTAADINDPNFGVAISAKGSGTSGTETASIDNITITVYYTPAGPCVRNAATASLAPLTGTITTDSGASVYTLTITNNDTGACASETFNLSKSDSNATNFDASTLSAASVLLAPGASSNTITLTAHGKAGQTSGSNTSSITAASINHADATTNTVTTTINIITCNHPAPTLSLAPATGTITTDSGTAVYTLTIVNNDAGCAGETFNLSASDSNATNFDASTLSVPSVFLASGAMSNTITLTVHGKAGQTSGVNNVQVCASNANHTTVCTTNVITTLSVPTCNRVAPTVSLAPATGTITTDSGASVYTLSITNNDTGACASETFNLSKSDSNATNFDASTLSAASVLLAPGASSNTITLTAHGKAGQTSGSNTSSITAASLNHADATTNTVNTTLSVSGGGSGSSGKSPTVAASNAAVGTVAWTNPANSYTSNNLYATAAMGKNIISNYLVASGFNFAIPAGSTIDGIAVSVERKEGTTFTLMTIKDNSVKLVKGGAITGTEHAGTTDWGSTEAIATYGSGADLWGTAWTVADINDPNFGVAISAKGSGTSGTETASIDNITITVYYTVSGICARVAPTVSLSPATGQITTDAGTYPYTLTITNNDSNCGSETFNLSANDGNLTVFNASTLSSPSVVLASGASSSTIIMTARAKTGQTNGTNASYVTAASANHDPATTSNNVTTTLNVVPCTRNQPTVALSPASRTISTDGGTASYDVTITNNDTGCAAETFTPSAIAFDDNSTNFNASTVCSTPVTLLPGAVSTPLAGCVTVTAKTGQSSGLNNTHINVTSPNHASQSSNNVQTTISACVKITPTISLAPLTGSILTEAGTTPYTFSITNNDSVYCASETFNLAKIDSNAVDFDASLLSSASIVLAPGQSSSTITLTVRAKVAHASGINNSHVNVTRQGQSHADSTNDVTTTLSAPVCTRTAPTVSLDPVSGIISSDSGIYTYTLTITNNDSNCAAETFNLGGNDSNTTNFDASTLSAASVNLASGATSSAITLTAHAKPTHTSGTNTSYIAVTSANHLALNTNNVTTTLNVPICTINAPLMIITPASQTVTPGGTIDYIVKIKNTDTGACTPTTFNLSVVSDSNLSPSTFKSSTLSSSSLVLAGGATGTVNLTVSSQLGVLVGASNITTVGAGAIGHASPANVTGTTTVAPISLLMHNSDNTTSTKWAPDGWGIPGGRYGEFKCSTCHSPETGNIKGIKEMITSPNAPIHSFPGGAVSLQSLNQYGDDTGGHANSNRVCEVCHTYDPSQAAGVKQHAYNMPSDPAHYNGVDCMTCHKHQGGFKPSNCTACHGAPPTVDTVGGPNGLSSYLGKVTGSATAGKHVTHAATLGYSCNTCHNGYVMPTASTVLGMENQWDISISFNAYGTTTGSYTGQVGVSYNQTAGLGGLTCSAIYCHGNTLTSSGTKSDPTWTGTVTCGDCHGAKGGTSLTWPTTNAHARHAGTGAGQLNLACADCHGATATDHVNGSVAWSLNTANARFGAGAAYKTLPSGTTGAIAPSATFGSCSTIYCHSNVQGAGGSGSGAPTSYASPAWDGGALGCGSCHVDMSLSASATGSHIKHAQTQAFACATCHTGNTHVNYAIELGFSGVATGTSYATKGNSFAPGVGYSTCSTNCHSTTNTANTTPAWGTAGDCTTCHSLTPATGAHTKHLAVSGVACGNCHNGAVQGSNAGTAHYNNVIDVTNGYPASVAKHAVGTYSGTCSTSCHSATSTPGTTPTWGGSVTCDSCHESTPTTGTHTTHLAKALVCDSCHSGAPHFSGTIEVGNGYTASPVAKHAIGSYTGTCATTCHSATLAPSTTPTWGDLSTCGSCHEATPTTGTHTKHLTGISGIFSANAVCGDCHAGAIAGSNGGSNHTDGDIDVSNGHPSNVAKHNPGTYSGTCSTSYCHSNGAGTVKPPTWGNLSTGCNFCHDATPTTGSHTLHIAGGANYSFGCAECHGHAGSGATHGNGSITVVGSIGYNGSNQCTTSDCHSDGKAALSYATSPAWGGTFAGDRCAGCHGNSPNSNAHQAHVVGIHYNDVYNNVSGKIAAAAGAGTNAGHGNPLYSTTISCNICHSGTVTVSYNDNGSACSTASCHGTGGTAMGALTTASLNKTLHVNRSREVSFANVTMASKSQLRDDITSVPELNANWARNNGYKAGESSNDASKASLNSASYLAGSCSAVACHNGIAVDWTAGSISCDKCHTALTK